MKRFDAKTAKRHKRQADGLTEGQDELALLGWMPVDSDITELFEKVVSKRLFDKHASSTPPN